MEHDFMTPPVEEGPRTCTEAGCREAAVWMLGCDCMEGKPAVTYKCYEHGIQLFRRLAIGELLSFPAEGGALDGEVSDT